jgi:hypothetical protein
MLEAGTATRMSQVTESLTRLERAIEDLTGTINTIEERFDRILLQQPPEIGFFFRRSSWVRGSSEG